MKALPIFAICSLLLLAACVQQPAQPNQSVQEIVSQTPDFEENEAVPEVNETPRVINATVAPKPIDITDETPYIYKKCRFSAILSNGCKWTDKTETEFNLKILSSAKVTIPGVWFFITGESGNKTVKREESILSGGSRTFRIDYSALVGEIGKVTRFEVLPIEIINDTVEVACLNQHVYTIPETYCVPSEPVKVD